MRPRPGHIGPAERARPRFARAARGQKPGRIRALVILHGLLLLAAAGCASPGEPSGAPSGEPFPTDPSTAPPSHLYVTNRNWLDMRIYALRGADRRHLLSLTSMHSDSVALPGNLLGGSGFRLLADPVGDDPYRSQILHLRPGQSVWWRLENVLSQSTIWIH